MKTVQLLFIAIALVVLPSQTNKSDLSGTRNASRKILSQEEKEERNKQIALASVKAVSSGDVENACKDLAPDVINYGNGNIPPVQGIDKVKAGMSMFVGAIPIDKTENLVAIADGDWVMVWGEWSGTWKGDMMGQKATGKPFRKKDVEIFRFNNDGKISEHHSVQSFCEVARQIGMKMP
jgi:predicted ester cyclase